MNDDIYQTELLRLAADAAGAGRLPSPDGTATVDNPLCGDRVTLDVKLSGGKIAAIGHDVRACLLCQASASVIGRHAAGRDAGELQRVMTAVAELLKKPAETTALPWPELAAFAPVAQHRSRHACVLLPFRALTQAVEAAAAKPN
ncbi:MAG TPA: iron-sulfur cluster assembly scaffold protein [Candidatus Cybelea sp.]|nr:iron-sulfur cluster assembly scaffold protein [Candidatus Cybelea sp.]